MTERRRRSRIRVDSVALIVTKTGNPVTCRIIDQSEDGARLFVDSVLGIPNHFRLLIQKTGEELPALVVWRAPHEIGVAFVDTRGVSAVAPNAVDPRPVEIALPPDLVMFAPENQAESRISSADSEP